MLTRRLKQLLAALALPLSLSSCGIVARQIDEVRETAATVVPHAGRSGRLSAKETEWARTAWRYVMNNTNDVTGLVNGRDHFPSFTMSGVADYLAALTAARELRLIDEREFGVRMSRLLDFLNTMDLAGGGLPNKTYNALTGKMVNFSNQPDDIGWSAVDIGRLLLWMKIVGQRHPQYREYFDKAVLRWNFCEVIDDCGTLYGTARSGGQTYRYQEGRLGYEQLASAGFAAWGFDARRTAGLPPTETIPIDGLPIRYDARESRESGVPTPVLTMPHVLMGMEFGWRPPRLTGDPERTAAELRQLADSVYRVQEARYRKESVFTARSDYQIAQPPYVVYDAVFVAGYPWNTVAPDGKPYEKLALVSTRAAFGMWALWPGDYTDRLVASLENLFDPDRGWFEGRLEQTGAIQESITLATNAAVLESLLFKVKGPLYAPDRTPGYFEKQLADVYNRPGRCFPVERKVCLANPSVSGRP